MRSQLAPYAAAMREPDPNAARRAAREAWQRQGIVLINPEWLHAWTDRKQLELLAEKVHGPKQGGSG